MAFREVVQTLVERSGSIEYKPIIILVGRTNAGKSTFINAITHKEDLVKLSQWPMSRAVHLSFPWKFASENSYFLELPCLSDEPPYDSLILARIAESLLELRKLNAYIAGVVYLHDFSTPDEGVDALKAQLEYLERLFGKYAKCPRILVLNKCQPPLEVDHIPAAIKTVWQILRIEENPIGVIGNPIGSPKHLIVESFKTNLLEPLEKQQTTEVTKRNQAVSLLKELLDGRSLRNTLVGEYYTRKIEERIAAEGGGDGGWLKAKLRKWNKERIAAGGGGDSGGLKAELEKWKTCKFPGVCECWQRL